MRNLNSGNANNKSLTKSNSNSYFNLFNENEEILKLIIAMNKPYKDNLIQNNNDNQNPLQISNINLKKEKSRIIPDKYKCKKNLIKIHKFLLSKINK